MTVSVPLRGVGCFDLGHCISLDRRDSVPLRGVGCFNNERYLFPVRKSVSVPLRGVSCFRLVHGTDTNRQGFPSPCGVWVVSGGVLGSETYVEMFPSPCGVWVVSSLDARLRACHSVSVPLRGVGCFRDSATSRSAGHGFRPLAGCGLFLPYQIKKRGTTQWFPSPCGVWVVSVDIVRTLRYNKRFRPLAGCGLFRQICINPETVLILRLSYMYNDTMKKDT